MKPWQKPRLVRLGSSRAAEGGNQPNWSENWHIAVLPNQSASALMFYGLMSNTAPVGSAPS